MKRLIPFLKKKKLFLKKSSNKKKYSWKYIDNACANIAKQYPVTIPRPRIVGISRGGLIPAVLLAKYLKAGEVYSIGLKSYKDDSEFASRLHEPDVYQNIQYNCPRLARGEPILLVDDISDEGNTLHYVRKEILNFNSTVIYTATIFIKDKTNFAPDIYHVKVPDNQWVVFPWEK